MLFNKILTKTRHFQYLLSLTLYLVQNGFRVHFFRQDLRYGLKTDLMGIPSTASFIVFTHLFGSVFLRLKKLFRIEKEICLETLKVSTRGNV